MLGILTAKMGITIEQKVIRRTLATSSSTVEAAG